MGKWFAVKTQAGHTFVNHVHVQHFTVVSNDTQWFQIEFFGINSVTFKCNNT